MARATPFSRSAPSIAGTSEYASKTAIRREHVGQQRGVGDAVVLRDVRQRLLRKSPEIAVMCRTGQAAHPGVFDLLGPPVEAHALPVGAEAIGVAGHGGVDVQQRAIGVEHRRADAGTRQSWR